jgi:transposase
MENGKEIHIGVDVSKATLDISDGYRFERIDNDKKTVTAFLREYKHCQIRVSAESTGPYHKVLAEVCHKLEIPFFLCDGKQVAYAKKAKGRYVKTDKADAEFLRTFAADYGIKPYVLSKELIEIRELANLQHLEINRLRSLKNHKDAISTTNAAKELERQIKQAEKTIDRFQEKINSLIQLVPELLEKKKLLCSVKGIGEKIATTLIVFLPELGSCNRRQIASLCGLAPFNNESGTYRGHRYIKGGRSRVRTALYMAALVSISHCGFYSSTYHKMVREQNRPAKVALVMVARKLVCYLNSLMKRVG